MDELTGSLSFGTTFVTGEDVTDSRVLSIRNDSDQDKEYKVDVTFNVNARGSKDGEAEGVKLTAPGSITVKANKKEEITADLLLPATAATGIYEGYVTFTNVEFADEVVRIPFAVRKVKEGVDYVQSSDILSTVRENGYVRKGSLTGSFSLNSHMKNVDLFLVDAETNKEIGFIASMDGRFIAENTPSYLYGYFNGNYYPFTDDRDHPIGYEPIEADQGAYKMKFIFTDDSGKETVIEKPFILDNEMGSFTTDQEKRIIELEADQTAYTFKGQIHDHQIDLAKKAGIEVDQGDNVVSYRTSGSYYDNPVALNETGDYTINAYVPTYKKVMSVTVKGRDRAGIESQNKEYHFVRKGTPYLATVPSQDSVMTGEGIDYSVSAHYIDDWKQITYTYTFDQKVLSVENVAVVPELSDKVTVDTESTPQGMKVVLSSKTGEPITSSGSLLKISAKLKSENFYSSYMTMTANSITLTKADDTTVKLEGISPSVKGWSNHSELTGDMNGEAVFLRDFYGKLLTTDVDYEALGATIKAVGPDGKEYEGTVIGDGRFKINLLSTQEKMVLSFDVPGHLTVKKEFQIGRENGYGEEQTIKFFPAIAGDANHDQIVDIRDAVYLETHWGSSDRQADINFDGTVDMKDMTYIKENFLKVNPMMDVKEKVKDKDAGRSLGDILNGLKE
ncbi:Fn3-like domain-containing protein [Rossellomorea aquimaris]|nr:Fn3-like domain-containing protein [Rossellomorea aquimaris]